VRKLAFSAVRLLAYHARQFLDFHGLQFGDYGEFNSLRLAVTLLTSQIVQPTPSVRRTQEPAPSQNAALPEIYCEEKRYLTRKVRESRIASTMRFLYSGVFPRKERARGA